MTLEELRKTDWIVLETIVGSQAYGTNEASSDIDLKGIYILPEDYILSYKYIPQISDEKNNETYYEIKRFIELLVENNPTVIEILCTPQDCIKIQHPVMNILLARKNEFLTKRCKESFGRYAESQIRKAKGMKKKINNPVDKERKNPLDFCYVIDNCNTYNLKKWLDYRKLEQKFCGLVNLSNAKGAYSIFYDWNSHYCFSERYPSWLRKIFKIFLKGKFLKYKGILKEDDAGELLSNDLRLSSIPKNQKAIAVSFYNKDGYVEYCKDYKDYWDWVGKRNPERFKLNTEHKDLGYDLKNIMHCVRLLKMCLEIGKGEGVQVRRTDREFLLDIKHGKYVYEDVMKVADLVIADIEYTYNNTSLPDTLPEDLKNEIILDVRKAYYNK